METSVSLLESLRAASSADAWDRLVELYSPLIRRWLRHNGAAAADIDDIVQEVLTVVVRRFPDFQREPRTGAFRRWLRIITVNCVRDHWKRKNKQARAVGGTEFVAVINQLEDANSPISEMWDREHDTYVTEYLLRQIRGEFSKNTWRAFQLFALDGHSAAAVASQLGISANAVFIAKSRVLSRLRQQGRGLID